VEIVTLEDSRRGEVRMADFDQTADRSTLAVAAPR
jgi:hypothetical protein